MGEQRIAWIANEGVRESRLVQHVQARNLTEPQRQLVEEMLATKPPELPSPPAEQPPSPPNPMPVTPQVVATGQGAGLPPAQGPDATWTIPLQVSVSLGQASLQLLEGAMASEDCSAVSPYGSQPRRRLRHRRPHRCPTAGGGIQH